MKPEAIHCRSLAESSSTKFPPPLRRLTEIPVPANYVLGPGDELLIHVWGKIDLDTRVTVDRNGQVFVPTIGNLTVAGLRFDQLQNFLHSAIATLYKDFDLNVSLGPLRSIQVFVLGVAAARRVHHQLAQYPGECAVHLGRSISDRLHAAHSAAAQRTGHHGV